MENVEKQTHHTFALIYICHCLSLVVPFASVAWQKIIHTFDVSKCGNCRAIVHYINHNITSKFVLCPLHTDKLTLEHSKNVKLRSMNVKLCRNVQD